MGKKLTKKERNWILYDVGNSAFTLLIATILPIYFNYLAGNAGISSVDYLVYWGYAASVGTILVALAGPVLGTMADTKGFKKPIFTAAILTGVASCALLGLAKGWLLFLVIYIIAKVGFSSSLIFYDSMLGDVTKTAWTMFLRQGTRGDISEAVCRLLSVWCLCLAAEKSESAWKWQWEPLF